MKSFIGTFEIRAKMSIVKCERLHWNLWDIINLWNEYEKSSVGISIVEPTKMRTVGNVKNVNEKSSVGTSLTWPKMITVGNM